MSEADTPGPRPDAEIILAPEKELTAPRTDMTVGEMREWLRNWVANATGQAPGSIDESVPMVELGLSSRDAVAMASDVEDLIGKCIYHFGVWEPAIAAFLQSRLQPGDLFCRRAALADGFQIRVRQAGQHRHRDDFGFRADGAGGVTRRL